MYITGNLLRAGVVFAGVVFARKYLYFQIDYAFLNTVLEDSYLILNNSDFQHVT